MLNIRTHTGRQFDLFPGTKLSIEENSPMFSDAGSFSLPLELPETDNNLSILEYPHRADRRKKFITSIDVVISAGVWIRHARMDVESAGEKRNITVSLFFRESPFYQMIKDKRLTDIFKDKIRDDFAGQSESIRFSYWRNHMEKVMCGDVDDDFYIFQVCLKSEDKEVDEGDDKFNLKTTWTRYTILNMQNVPRPDGVGGSTKNSLTGKSYYGMLGVYEGYTEDGTTYWLPSGYGIAPFLKFTYVVRYVFTQLGYELKQSIFDTDPSFRKLCFIHNTADCLVRGFIDYSQIVPDIDLSDFLKMIENSFGCRFIVDESKKTVTPRFWKDVTTENPTRNLSGAFEDFPSLTFNEPSSLKLTVNRTLPETTPGEFETYPQLFARYGRYRGSYKNRLLLQIEAAKENLQEGIYLIQDTRTYAVVFKHYPDKINNPANYSWVVIGVEKDTLDYYDVLTDHSVEDRPLGFNVIALKDVALRGETSKRREVTVSKELKFLPVEEMVQELLKKFTTDDGIIGRIPYVDSIRHLNSAIQTTSTKDDVSTISTDEEKPSDLPVFLAMFHGFASPDSKRPNIEKTFFASTDAYDNTGSKLGTFDLSTRSLYANFWVDYDKLLESSFHQISGHPHLSLIEAMNISFESPYILDGQKVLIESIQYEISDNGIDVVEMKLKTIKQYD